MEGKWDSMDVTTRAYSIGSPAVLVRILYKCVFLRRIFFPRPKSSLDVITKSLATSQKVKIMYPLDMVELEWGWGALKVDLKKWRCVITARFSFIASRPDYSWATINCGEGVRRIVDSMYTVTGVQVTNTRVRYACSRYNMIIFRYVKKISIYLPIIVKLTLEFLVWAYLKSTRQRYMAASFSTTWSITKFAECEFTSKYALLLSTFSSHHFSALLKSFSLTSTLRKREKEKKLKQRKKSHYSLRNRFPSHTSTRVRRSSTRVEIANTIAFFASRM